MERIDERSVVSDTGPLIHLDELDCLDLLSDISPVVAPEIVFQEARRHRPRLHLDRVPGLRIVRGNDAPSSRLAALVDTFDLSWGLSGDESCRDSRPSV